MTHDKKNSLTLKAVYKSYEQGGKQLHVLQGIDATFIQGKSYAITGVSGSGKSTLMHILGGLDEPTQGAVFFNDKDIAHFRLSHKDFFHNRHIGFVFQFHYLIKELSVRENIMLMGLINGDKRKLCINRADHLLAMVGLADKGDEYPTKLSGGEQQRVSIARALFNRPAFLLADEPTGNLDADNAQQIVDLFFAAQQEWGMSIVICSHDVAVYKRMGTVHRLFNGVLVEQSA